MYKYVVCGLVGVFFLVNAQSAHAMKLCDSFGIDWNLTVTGDTLEGFLDTNNVAGCGPLYVRGMFGPGFGGTHFIVSNLVPFGSACNPVIWDGTWTGSSGSGTWFNDNGNQTGTFALTAGVCPASAAVDLLGHPAM